MSNEATGATTTTKPEIKISDVVSMLEAGTTREDIRIHYGLTKTQAIKLWKQPKLKGRKVHKERGSKGSAFEVIDDAPDLTPLPDRMRKAKKEEIAADAAEVATAVNTSTTSVAPVENTISEAPVETSEESIY